MCIYIYIYAIPASSTYTDTVYVICDGAWRRGSRDTST